MGQLPPSVSAELLLELLQQAGPVTQVHMPRTPDGAPRGFAFGEYAGAQSAAYAIALLDGVSLGGSRLRLRMATRQRSGENGTRG